MEGEAGNWCLVVTASAMVRSVSIVDENFLAADDGFPLAPGERRLALLPRPCADAGARPQGEVRGLDAVEVAHYRA